MKDKRGFYVHIQKPLFFDGEAFYYFLLPKQLLRGKHEMKKLTIVLTLLAVTLFVAACSKESGGTLNDKKLVIGATDGPHAQILEVVKEVAAEDGLELEIKPFTDYVLPNTALDEGDLDVNSYQHKPFLEKFNEDHGTDLVPVGKTILNPMGIYSETYKNFDELPDGAKFGLPNDPTNGSRALFILQESGYIKLEEGKEETASIHDVVENPKNLEFIELDAAQIPKQVSEDDAAAINTNFAMEAGLSPKDDSILLEPADSPYVNVIVVRPGDEDSEDLKKFIEAYHSEEVRQYIEETYDGAVIPGF